MNLLLATLQIELRLRARRTGTLVVLLGVLAISWLGLSDPADGVALLVVDDARIRYSSAALAFGSASLGALLFSLAGFYLVRGRVQEDLQSSVGHLLAASPMRSSGFLLARWLAGVAFLALLALALMLSTWLLHLLRGEGPWQPGEYLLTYLLLLTPSLMLTSAMALLFDAWGPLMGRRGDVAYFCFWTLLLALVPAGLAGHSGTEPPSMLLLDASGIGTGIHRLTLLLGSDHIGVGGSSFNAALPLREFPSDFWTGTLALQRLGSGLLALPPLLLALLVFHRYDPARVRARHAGSSGGRVNRWLHTLLQPLRRALLPLLTALPALPRPAAAPLAELLLVFLSQPWALLLLAAAWIGPWVTTSPPGWLAACALAWGVLVSELGSRGAQDGGHGAPDALPGGHRLRWMSRLGAAGLLGLLLLAPLLVLRPGWTVPLVGSLMLLSGLALLLGQWTRSSRPFLALFLFGWFVAVQTGGLGLR